MPAASPVLNSFHINLPRANISLLANVHGPWEFFQRNMTMDKKQIAPKLACTASGLQFDCWRERPAYKVHCKTAAIARQLCNVQLPEGMSLATRLDQVDDTGLSTFRALRPYRSEQAKRLRDLVARIVKASRHDSGGGGEMSHRDMPQAAANGILRDSTDLERKLSARAPSVLTLRKHETGWKAVPVANGDGTVLVSSDGNKAVPFFSTNLRSGTEALRQAVLAQCYAIDNPYVVDLPKGELVVKPLCSRC